MWTRVVGAASVVRRVDSGRRRCVRRCRAGGGGWAAGGAWIDGGGSVGGRRGAGRASCGIVGSAVLAVAQRTMAAHPIQREYLAHMASATRFGAYGRPLDRFDPRPPVLFGAVAAVQFVGAWIAASSLDMFLAVVGLVTVGTIYFVVPSVLLVAAFPASFGTLRVGPGAAGLSLADFIAAAAAVASLPHVPWRSKAFRLVFATMVGYCAVVAVSVAANPSSIAAIEVVHRFVMVMGAVCVGSAVVVKGRVKAALRLLVVFAAYVGVMEMLDAASHGFQPAYAMSLQKNAGGSLLAVSMVALAFGHRFLGWPRFVKVILGVAILGGLAATQSRGAMFSLAMVAAVFSARTTWKGSNRWVIRRLPLLMLVVVALVSVATVSLKANIDAHKGSDQKFGAVGSRDQTYTIAINEVFRPKPILGAGPKWFFRPGAPGGEPHNIVIDELASDGAAGMIAFGFVVFTLLRVARMGGPVLGELAFYALLSRFLSTMSDLFWVAGPSTLPFLLFGLGVGAAALRESAEGGEGLVRADPSQESTLVTAGLVPV